MDIKKGEFSEKTKEALRQMLAGVKDRREEAFILLIALPENFLTDAVEYLRRLAGLEKIHNIH
jgi:hypothetical protein